MKPEVAKKIKGFFDKYPAKKYKKGDLLVMGGESPPGVFYLEGGKVRVYGITSRGDKVTITLFKPGTFFPMSWAFNMRKNDYTYEAAIESVVRVAPVREIVGFLQNESEVVWDLLERLYIGMEGFMERMVVTMAESAYKRLGLNLLISAKRFGVEGGGGVLELDESELDLAAESGLSRETVSRMLAKYKKAGILEIGRNKIVIKSLPELENEVTRV